MAEDVDFASQTRLFAEKADFLLCEAAYNAKQTDQSFVLITLQKIDRSNFKPTKEEVEASQRGENIEAPMCVDQFVLGDHDSLRLMLAVASIRAAQGCIVSKATIKAARRHCPGS